MRKTSNTEAVRDLRRVEFVDSWPVLQYDRTDSAGVYEATVGEPPLSLKFATQPQPNESSLEELSAGQVEMLKVVAHVIPWTPNFSLREVVEKQRSGVEFWLPIMIAALLVGLVETFLGQWFSKSK